MSATRARSWLSMGQFNLLPRVGREVVDTSFIGSIALLETAKNDHLSRFKVDAGCMFISVLDLVTSSSNHRPAHCAQIQIVKLFSVSIFVVFVVTVLTR